MSLTTESRSDQAGREMNLVTAVNATLRQEMQRD